MPGEGVPDGGDPALPDLVVRVAERDRFGGSGTHALVQREGLACPGRRVDDAERRQPVAIVLGHLDRVVGRPVVHEQDLPPARPRLARKGIQLDAERPLGVSARDDDAEGRSGRRRARMRTLSRRQEAHGVRWPVPAQDVLTLQPAGSRADTRAGLSP